MPLAFWSLHKCFKLDIRAIILRYPIETFKVLENVISVYVRQYLSAGTREDFSYVRSITVLINNIPVELPVGSINVRAVFGENAVLFHSTGHPVLINEWGFTLECLQHGATYYMVCVMPMQIFIHLCFQKLSK